MPPKKKRGPKPKQDFIPAIVPSSDVEPCPATTEGVVENSEPKAKSGRKRISKKDLLQTEVCTDSGKSKVDNENCSVKTNQTQSGDIESSNEKPKGRRKYNKKGAQQQRVEPTVSALIGDDVNGASNVGDASGNIECMPVDNESVTVAPEASVDSQVLVAVTDAEGDDYKQNPKLRKSKRKAKQSTAVAATIWESSTCSYESGKNVHLLIRRRKQDGSVDQNSLASHVSESDPKECDTFPDAGKSEEVSAEFDEKKTSNEAAMCSKSIHTGSGVSGGGGEHDRENVEADTKFRLESNVVECLVEESRLVEADGLKTRPANSRASMNTGTGALQAEIGHLADTAADTCCAVNPQSISIQLAADAVENKALCVNSAEHVQQSVTEKTFGESGSVKDEQFVGAAVLQQLATEPCCPTDQSNFADAQKAADVVRMESDNVDAGNDGGRTFRTRRTRAKNPPVPCESSSVVVVARRRRGTNKRSKPSKTDCIDDPNSQLVVPAASANSENGAGEVVDFDLHEVKLPLSSAQSEVTSTEDTLPAAATNASSTCTISQSPSSSSSPRGHRPAKSSPRQARVRKSSQSHISQNSSPVEASSFIMSDPSMSPHVLIETLPGFSSSSAVNRVGSVAGLTVGSPQKSKTTTVTLSSSPTSPRQRQKLSSAAKCDESSPKDCGLIVSPAVSESLTPLTSRQSKVTTQRRTSAGRQRQVRGDISDGDKVVVSVQVADVTTCNTTSADSTVSDSGPSASLKPTVLKESDELVTIVHGKDGELARANDSHRYSSSVVETVKHCALYDDSSSSQLSLNDANEAPHSDEEIPLKKRRIRAAFDLVTGSQKETVETTTTSTIASNESSITPSSGNKQHRATTTSADMKSAGDSEKAPMQSSVTADVLTERSVNLQDGSIPVDSSPVSRVAVVPRRGNKFVGAHVGISGNVSAALKMAHQSGFHAFGMFIKRQSTLFPESLQSSDIAEFRQLIKAYDIAPHLIVPHASYLLNCGSSDTTVYNNSRDSLVDDLQRCRALGLPLFNFHPGWYEQNSNADDCIVRIANCINFAHSRVPSVVTVLENMCGETNTVGGSFLELRRIINRITDKTRVGVCLDICHAFAFGYDLNTGAGRNKMMDDLANMIGLNYLKAVHVNDSRDDVCSRHDHHAAIGKGKISLELFKWLMNDPRFDNIPLILETPSAGHRSEIELLYGFVH